MLEVKDLHLNYGNTTILKGVSFDVNEGELCGLFGPNGCGKTTLFKCCLNFIKSNRGSIRMDGKDIKKLKEILSLISINSEIKELWSLPSLVLEKQI